MILKFKIGALMASLFLFWGCDKKNENDVIPAMSVIPVISIGKTEPNVIKQFDDVKIFIHYQDGDGDIGDADADEFSLEIIDQRDSILHLFHVPPQSQIEGIAIQGTLEINIENIILIDQSSQNEEINFEVRLKDRAGNWSNVVLSESVSISQ